MVRIPGSPDPRAAARRPALRRLASVLVLAPALTLLPPAAPAARATPPSSFAWGPCAVPVPAHAVDRVRCGVLTVPESRAAGSASQRVVRLPVAVIASRSGTPQPDPVVYPTSGGPGGGSLAQLATLIDWSDWAAAERAVILVEQRGDKLSEPTLNCPELDLDQQIVDGRLVTERDPGKVRQCRDRLAAAGVDLAAYTSTNSAADLADLRRAMGFDRWNLYGTSYGARLALTTMRDHPEGLRAVVLDGVYPPNVNLLEDVPAGYEGAVQRLLGSCASDERCRAGFPDLERSLHRLLEATASAPIEVTVQGPGRSALTVSVDDRAISEGLFQALYDSSLAPMLPWVIDQLARGNRAVALPLAQQQIDYRDWFAEGLALSVNCREETPFNDVSRVRAAYAATPLTSHLEVPDGAFDECGIWGVPALEAVENEAVRSGIPTLLASGGYDPITPPSWADAGARGLSHAYLFEFPAAGHGAVWQNWYDPCPAAVAGRFLRDPARAPDASCIAATPAVSFLTPDQIIPTPAVYLLDRDVIRPAEPVQLTLLGGLASVFLLTVAFGCYALIRRRAGSVPATVAAVLASALQLAFIGGFYWTLTRTDPLILGFGLPTAARALGVVAIVAAGVTVVSGWLLLRPWLRRAGRTRPSWPLVVAWVASVTFLGWLLARGLVVL